MNNTLHKCPKNECTKQLSFEVLACTTHWAQVPLVIRNDLYAAWRSGNFAEYLGLRAAAVAAMNEGASTTND